MNYGSIQREEESESQFGRTDNISMSSMLSPTERKRYTSEDYSIVSDSIFHSQEGDRPEITLLDTYDNVPVSEALDLCTKSVVRPYNYLLKIVGWRKFRSRSEGSLRQCFQRAFNWVYLVAIILLMLAVCIIQILMCLRRDVVGTKDINDTQCRKPNGYICKDCLKHSITVFFIPDILLFIAYCYALYIFRFEEPDYLQMLTETVFLSQASPTGSKRQKKLIHSLWFQLLLGVIWMLWSLAVSVFRLIVREYALSRTPPLVQLSDAPRIILEIICSLGFIIFDTVYVSVVMNYSFQCQLLMYHIKSVKSRVMSKEWSGIHEGQTASATGIEPVLEKAVKELEQLKSFFIHLNRHISWAVSLMIFIFVTSILDAAVALTQFGQDPNGWLVASCILNCIQWTSILSIPLIQGARLNSCCASLKRLGHQIRARPLPYTETSFLHLDSFLTYISSQRLHPKFFNIAVTPGTVIGLIFLIGCIIVVLLQVDYFAWATYF
jgi:hypothetical protein